MATNKTVKKKTNASGRSAAKPTNPAAARKKKPASGTADTGVKADAKTKPAAPSGKSSRPARSASPDPEKMRRLLIELRDRVTGQISFLSDDAHHQDDTPTDDRTDEFDREFAFNLVSTEQNALYEIDEALRRIDRQMYGKCESCSGSIENNRLKALPFARNCLRCQADIEKGVIRGSQPRRSEPDGEEHHFEEIEDADTATEA